MSNQFSRVRYDDLQLTQFDKQNKSANVLLLDETVKESNTACYAPAGSRCAQSEVTRPYANAKLDLGMKADIENRVMNRNYELNNHEGRTNTDFMTNIGNNPSLCNVKETLTNEDSRFTNPIEDYREMYTAPYAFTPYLFVSPQAVHANNNDFMTPDRYGASSRYAAKQDKYGLGPKEFAARSKPVNFVELHSGLLPQKGTAFAAFNPNA